MSLILNTSRKKSDSLGSFLSPPSPPRMAEAASAPVGRRRPVLLLGVMLLCAAGFWMNFERRFAAIEAENGLRDRTGILSESDRRSLMALRQTMRDQWGLQVRIRVDDQLSAETPDAAILLELVPAGTPPQARVHAPPLVARALNAPRPNAPRQNALSFPDASPFLDDLTRRLSRCAQNTPAGKCLETALVDILLALNDTGPNTSTGTSPSTSALLPPAESSPQTSAPPQKTPVSPETPAGSVWRAPLTGVQHD